MAPTDHTADYDAPVEHDEWCDANGCRCGKCPCLGPPWCVIPPEGSTDHTAENDAPTCPGCTEHHLTDQHAPGDPQPMTDGAAYVEEVFP